MWLTAVAQSSIALSDSSMIYSQELEGFLGRTKSIFIGSTLPVQYSVSGKSTKAEYSRVNRSGWGSAVTYQYDLVSPGVTLGIRLFKKKVLVSSGLVHLVVD